MLGKRNRKSLFLLNQRFLEADHIVERVLSHQCPTRVDLLTLRVVVSPTPSDIEILHRETEGIESGMATRATGDVSMFCESFADGEVSCIIFLQRRNIIWGRWGRIIEDDLDNPCSSCDGVGPFRARRHAQHGGIGDDATVSSVIGRHAVEILRSEFRHQLIVKVLLDLLSHFIRIDGFRDSVKFFFRSGEHVFPLFDLSSLCSRKGCQDFLPGDVTKVPLRRMAHFLCRQSAIIESCLVETQIQEFVAPGRKVPKTKDDLRSVFLKGQTVSFEWSAVRHAIAVKSSGPVLIVNHDQVQ